MEAPGRSAAMVPEIAGHVERLAVGRERQAGRAEHLVALRISPFGGSGPRAAWRSTAFTDDAVGGHLYLNGDPDREPLARPGLHSHYQAGLHAFLGALAVIALLLLLIFLLSFIPFFYGS